MNDPNEPHAERGREAEFIARSCFVTAMAASMRAKDQSTAVAAMVCLRGFLDAFLADCIPSDEARALAERTSLEAAQRMTMLHLRLQELLK